MEDLVSNVLSSLHGFYPGKRILITGHTGFKGAWLSLWLGRLGAQVIGYALAPPTTPNLFDVCQLGENMISIIADIRDLDRLTDIFHTYHPEIVFHLAAQSLVRYSYRKPVETYSTNVMGTVHLLEACRQTPSVRGLVNITSDKCYKNHEWVWGYREIDPLGGYDPYSSSKACAELVTDAYRKSFFHSEKYSDHGIAVATGRAGNVIGGGDWAEDRLIPDCIKAFQKNTPIMIRYPDAVRPWQHVLEPLFGYLLLAQHLYQDGPAFSGAWNFGPGDEGVKPVRWLVEQITALWGDNASWTHEHSSAPHESCLLKLECSKAKSRIGWYPQWGLQDAVKKTIDWYKAYCDHEDMVQVTLNQIQGYETDLGKSQPR